MSGPSYASQHHNQSRTPRNQQQASFVPTPPSGNASPASPLSPSESTSSAAADDLFHQSFVPKGQTLMTSYMVPVKPGSGTSASGRKRTKSHASTTSSLSSCPPQSLSGESPIFDPFVVPANGNSSALGHIPDLTLASAPIPGYYQVGPGGGVVGLKTQGVTAEGSISEGGLYQVYGEQHLGQGGYQVGYIAPGGGFETITPGHQHQQLYAYARPSPVGSLSSNVPLTPSTIIGTPKATSGIHQPLLTTSQLPLGQAIHFGQGTPSTISYAHPGHQQMPQIAYASPSYSYQPQFATPQAYAPVYSTGSNMPYTMVHPVYSNTPGPSYGYHLPPPPPPSQAQAGQYYHHGEYPQSAPAKAGSGYVLSAENGAYPQGFAPNGSHETPVKPKRASGSAGKGKAVAAGARAENVAGGELDGQSQSGRSSVESTPPPISRPAIPRARSNPSVASGSDAGASATSLAQSPSKKRASPSKQGSSDSGEQHAKRTRGLEIKRSSAEGRRLVFPETPSPEASHAELELPRTPPRQTRSLLLSPRKTEAPGLTQTPNGTASFGVKAILESDLSWLEPVLKPLESPYYSASKRPDAVINLTKSERRRRRVDAFKNAEEGEADLKTTVLKGYGRLAVKKTTALSFLGVDERNVEPQESTPTMTFTPIMKSRSLPNMLTSGPITPKSTPQSAHTLDENAPITVPDWPDTAYPWIGMVESRKKDSDKMTEVSNLEKLSRIERYLSHVSDDELEESDESEEQIDLSHTAIKTVEPSDAKEAMFNVTRNGLPAFSAGPSGPYLSGVMPTPSGEDESGCLCGGLQRDAGNMVCCDNCSIWFHLNCCGIASEDDLGESWFCWRCEPGQSSAVRNTPTMSDQVGTPKGQQTTYAGFAATDETSRTYRQYTSDAALAPSPVFSNSGRVRDLEDTPAMYRSRTPRIPSSGSTFRFMTPGTPALTTRMRNISYAEHYNVCQTPGASRESDYKIYSTPKFEDLLNDYTPHRATSPTPGGRSRVLSRNNPLFTTPSTSQSFLQGLQTGSSSATPGLVHSSSASAQYSPYPASPHSAPPKLHPALSDLAASPSPFRSHRRQVSFNRVTFATTASNLRDSMVLEDMQSLGKGRPLGLGGELGELSKK